MTEGLRSVMGTWESILVISALVILMFATLPW